MIFVYGFQIIIQLSKTNREIDNCNTFFTNCFCLRLKKNSLTVYRLSVYYQVYKA